MTLRTGSLMSRGEFKSLQVPLNGTVDDLVIQLSDPEGCSGFLATACRGNSECSDDDYDDYDSDPEPVSFALAEKLAANGGVLLEPGNTLSYYSVDSATCSGITLFAVYAQNEKQPTVFKKDLEELGLGERVYSYVKLNKEDKELVAAREYFRAPLFRWLQSNQQTEEGISQTLTLSMDDKFPDDEHRVLLTVQIVPEGNDLQISCTNLAGDLICSVTLARDDLIARLQSCLCDVLQWASVTLWDESGKVTESNHASRYSLLTAEQVFTTEQVTGCYQCQKFNLRPAGYSASSTSLSDILVLEPGKAALKQYFKGDYKRAEELLQLVMADAQWTLQKQDPDSETSVVRITGKAKLSRYWVHERSGSDGLRLNDYDCFALLTIPLQQLQRAQSEEYHFNSAEGGGWTCGSEDYKSSFFLPSCMLNALRTKPEEEEKLFLLRSLLNKDESPDYPYNMIASQGRRRFMREGAVPRLSEDTVGLIKYFREKLAGKSYISIDELMQLQASKPESIPPLRSDLADPDEMR